jgi:DNA-binding phage protein
MSIQRQLREIIRKHGLTPYAVAKALGIDHASLYKSLEDKANPE